MNKIFPILWCASGMTSYYMQLNFKNRRIDILTAKKGYSDQKRFYYKFEIREFLFNTFAGPTTIFMLMSEYKIYKQVKS